MNKRKKSAKPETIFDQEKRIKKRNLKTNRNYRN